MPGTAPTSDSWMFSTDLMKCVWPRMKLVSSGFSILTVMSCMAVSLRRQFTGISSTFAKGRLPGLIFLQAIFGADKSLPHHAGFEAVFLAFLHLANDVLKI